MPAVMKSVEDKSPETPEALFISALIDTGEFTPEQYRITAEHLSCWGKLFAFGVEHQARSGIAPPIELVKSKFPDFDYSEGMGPSVKWLAHKLHQAHASRTLRVKVKEALVHLAEDDLDAAYTALEGLQRPKSVRRAPVSVFDHAASDKAFEVSKIEVPYNGLGRATGGIGPGELWYIAGRPGTGKTWDLCQYAAKAVTQGYRVRFLSLEMRTGTIAMRALRCMATDVERAILDTKDREEIKKVIDAISQRLNPGHLDVVDPSHGRVTSQVVREHMEEVDLVIVDHAGLMVTNDGRRAVDDWRAQAIISNMLKEATLETGVPVLAGAQLNRTADTASPLPPKLSQLAQSDALGQDADVVITAKRLTKHVKVQSAEKVREGEGLRWYSMFNPGKGDFRELSKDAALEFMASDEDFQADEI